MAKILEIFSQVFWFTILAIGKLSSSYLIFFSFSISTNCYVLEILCGGKSQKDKGVKLFLFFIVYPLL